MTEVQRNDALFAHMALNLAPGLSGAARQVGGALVDHFNRKTGRCDPSLERLAGLLGLSKTTVQEATAALVRSSLFEKRSHGGRYHTASYTPNWQMFRQIVADWNQRMKGERPTETPPSKDAKWRTSDTPKGELDVRQMAKQTDLSNRSNEPDPVIPSARNLKEPRVEVGRGKEEGLGRIGVPRQLQRVVLYPLPGGKSPSRAEAAEEAAHRRLNNEIQSLPRHEREKAWLLAQSEVKA